MTHIPRQRIHVGEPRVLFLHVADAAAYPPVIHASALLASVGAEVYVLNSPTRFPRLQFPDTLGVKVLGSRVRPDYIVRPTDYADFCARTIAIAARIRPHWIYASDPLAGWPALAAGRLSGSRIAYHEHDSPDVDREQRGWVRAGRRLVARSARIVILPNEARAERVRKELDLQGLNMRVVWNVPRRSELPILPCRRPRPLIVHYHGNISSQMLPSELLEAVSRFRGDVRLVVAGYEAPGAAGYVQEAIRRWNGPDGPIEYLGAIPRAEILQCAANAHVGVALFPTDSSNVNLRHLAGASNKVFDYMAAGLAVLTSDGPDWRALIQDEGYGMVATPTSVASIEAALSTLLENSTLREAMGRKGRARIVSEWNYETAFAPVAEVILGSPR